MIERIVRWVIRRFLPGYHLQRNTPKGRRKIKEVREDAE